MRTALVQGETFVHTSNAKSSLTWIDLFQLIEGLLRTE